MESSSERVEQLRGLLNKTRVICAVSWQVVLVAAAIVIAALFQDVDETFLMTFRELDPNADRRNIEHLGTWTAGLGGPPDWPPGNGGRIFAYLKSFPALPQLLDAIACLPNPALIVADGIDNRLRERFARPNLRFAAGPVEMNQASRKCNLAILNGTHSSAAVMLLAGKPALHIPLFLEHALTGFAVAKIGAAVAAPPDDAGKVVAGLQSLLGSDRFAAAARAFSVRHADFNPQLLIERVVNRAERLATG